MAKLFIGNLTYSATEADIIGFFAENSIGASEVKLIKDRDTGAGKGFGFVEVPDNDAARAIELEGAELLGRRLKIDHAKPPQRGRA